MRVLDVNCISSGYGARKIISDISFSVARGEFAGIIGPNGSGKTTLFRTLSRYLPLFNGTIKLNDLELNAYRFKDFAKHIAVLPQSLNIPFSFSVEQFVALGRYPYTGSFRTLDDEDKRVIDMVLSQTDICGLRKRSIAQLSGGERQRVFIAQALAQQAGLLLLDEPTSHLDITHQTAMLDLLKKNNKESGLTVLAVFHDLNLASVYCDKLILIDKGKVFKAGTPEEVLTYRIIEEVYRTVVIVDREPLSGRPFVVPVPEHVKNNASEFKVRVNNSKDFFANKDCQYYPCHDLDGPFNCLFCYCPLYTKDCPGQFTLLKNGKKNCRHCTFIHGVDAAEKVRNFL